mmetsp:Transcript_50810/g.99353  ORF Transcript_50810/g.99353 Transcript_50810/m.99353 type:complete len:173 (+) Transcript_50810:63-581(+)
MPLSTPPLFLLRSIQKRSRSAFLPAVRAVTRRRVSSAPPPSERATTFWERWTAPVEMPQSRTGRWFAEIFLINCVFAVTGSATMFLVRPAITDLLKLEGSMRNGPWSYRLTSLVVMTPLYPCLLVAVGTAAGRHAYFRHMAVGMVTRFGIPSHMVGGPGFYGKGTGKVFKKW